MTKTTLQKSDVLDGTTFLKVRDQMRREILEIKKLRRLGVGPDVTVYFESKETLLWQVQEMLRVEQGGDAQLDDELAAYAPLVPRGLELVATIMIEITDPERRRQALSQLGHIENHFVLRFGGHSIVGQPEQDTERTNESGKTSAVHFVRWSFTAEQVLAFSKPQSDVIFEVSHPGYHHKVLIPESTRLLLATDL